MTRRVPRVAVVLALTALAAASAGAAHAAGGTPDVASDRSFAEAAAESGSAPTVDHLPKLVLDAHRAGGLEARENSLSGIQHALESGVVDVVDLDVHRLEDGALGVMHDPTVDRVTTSTGATAAYTRDEWQALRLDIGSWLVPQPPREAPPTLAEVLRRFGDRSVFTVEVKEGLIDEVAHLLRHRHLADSVLVNTNRPRVARAIHRQGLHAHLWRSARQMRTDDPRSWARWLDVVDVDVRARRTDTREFVTSGIPRVWGHTVTTRAERDRAMRLGVDGIVTDDPRYLSGVSDVYPVSPTVIDLQEKPTAVQVSDRTRARVAVSSESGPVIPGAVVAVGGREVTGRTVAHPMSGVSTVRVSAAGADKGTATVRFRVAAGRGDERRWGAAEMAVPLEVIGEDLQLVPSIRTTGRRLEVTVDLLDSASRPYRGPGRERGTGVRSVAGLAHAGLRLRVLHHGIVVHRQRMAGADTGTPGNGAGTVAFSPWKAPRAGHYRVQLSQRGPVYRHVTLERRVRVR